MLLFPPAAGPAAARRTSSALLVLLVILSIIQVSVAQDTTGANDAATTDAATTDDTTATTASETTASNTDSTSSAESTTSSSSTSTSTPVVTVPPTADAPYMQTSSTPEGAVFIAVGAVLGFFGLAVLAWRGLVAWSVNRSVRQAAMMHSSETKGLLRSRRKRSTVRSRGPSGSGMPFSKPGGGGPGGGYQRHRSGSGSGSHGPPPKTSKVVPSSNSGLFFSPTAGARMYSSSRRPPVFHPSGYHAAPGGDAPQSPPYRPHPQSYNNNTAYTYSHSRGQSGPSPPTSPVLYPTGAYDTHARYPMSRPMSSDNTSNSSLNLNAASPPQGRAPSEYLEDLFDNHGQVPPTGRFGRR